MGILVAVTINFVTNGGIIGKAKSASNQMQLQADREELQMAVIASMDYITGEVDFDDLETNLPNWSISGNTCTSPSGNVFSVSSDGTITLVGEGSGESSSSGSGSYYGSGSGSYYDSGSGSGSDDYSGSGSGSGSAPEYSSSLQYVRMNNIDYIVFKEDNVNGTVDLISTNAIGSATLGDGNSFSNSASSYNNMVETLVTACYNATGLTVDGTNVISVRSVGNTNVKYTNSGITGSDNPGTYTYDYQTAGAQSDWFTTNGFNSYNLKDEDNNYESDYNTMGTLGICESLNSEDYWLASRYVNEGSSYVGFHARYVYGSGNLGSSYLCSLDDNGNAYCSADSYAVRPVVTLNSTLLSSAPGSGTSSDPFVIQ